MGGIDEWVFDSRAMEILSGAEVQLFINDGAVVVDLRSPTAFATGHIEGAVNIAPADLISDPADALSGVSLDTTIILYGAGGPVASEYEAAAAISAAGYTSVLYYSPGWLDWD